MRKGLSLLKLYTLFLAVDITFEFVIGAIAGIGASLVLPI